MRLIASAERASEKLDWRPEISLDEGLEKTVEFLREHPEHLKHGRYTV